MEHESNARPNGQDMSESLQRELEEVLGQQDAEAARPAPPEERMAPEEDPLAQAEAKTREYLSILQRTQADFQNYKKRVEQERRELREQLRGDVIARVLPVLDDLSRALREVPAELAGSPWVLGVELVQRKLLALLQAEGVTPLEAQGQPFDPRQHEAVHHQATNDHPEGHVMAVFRDGYKLGDRVLRPAQVIVAKPAARDPAAPPEDVPPAGAG